MSRVLSSSFDPDLVMLRACTRKHLPFHHGARRFSIDRLKAALRRSHQQYRQLWHRGVSYREQSRFTDHVDAEEQWDCRLQPLSKEGTVGWDEPPRSPLTESQVHTSDFEKFDFIFAMDRENCMAPLLHPVTAWRRAPSLTTEPRSARPPVHPATAR